MSTYINPTADGNAHQHNGDVYNNNNNSTNTYNVQNQLPNNPLTSFMSTQGQPTALHKTCAKGDESLVRSMLSQSTKELEEQDDEWRTPLQLAICKNKVGVVRVLLEFGANVEARNVMWAGSQRPIILAVLNGNEELVRLLVESGAEIEEVGTKGQTPVGLAAREGFDRIVSYLISKGAKINTKDAYGKHTPLWWAAQGGHLNTVAVLMQHGASAGGTDNRGRSIFDHTRRFPQITQLLRSGSAQSHSTTSDHTNPNGFHGVQQTSPHDAQSFKSRSTPFASTTFSSPPAAQSHIIQSAAPQKGQNMVAQDVHSRQTASELPTINAPYTTQNSNGSWYPPAQTAPSFSHPLPPPNMPYTHANGAWSTGGFQRYPSNQAPSHAPSAYAANGWMENGASPQSKTSRGRIFLEKLLGRAVRVL